MHRLGVFFGFHGLVSVAQTNLRRSFTKQLDMANEHGVTIIDAAMFRVSQHALFGKQTCLQSVAWFSVKLLHMPIQSGSSKGVARLVKTMTGASATAYAKECFGFLAVFFMGVVFIAEALRFCASAPFARAGV